MKRTVFMLLLCLCGCFLLAGLFAGGPEADIKNQELQFCKGLGWINWMHAKPEGTRKAFRDFQLLNRKGKDSFEYHYAQKMKAKMGCKYLVAELAETRMVEGGLNEADERTAFLQIFVSVSTAFETLQGQFPYRFIPACQSSSFMAGDLAGNLISYYGAVSNTSIAVLQKSLPLYSAAQCLAEYHKNGLGKKHWNGLQIDFGTGNSHLEQLAEILKAAKENRPSFSRQVSQKKSFYAD